MKGSLLIAFAASSLMTGSLLAQSAPAAAPGSSQPQTNTVNDRRENQQDRIANGVGSGQLTAGETKNLESREANVNREIKDDRSADGGKLTPAERGQVNKQQNNLSKSIYTDKHNAAQQNYKGEVERGSTISSSALRRESRAGR